MIKGGRAIIRHEYAKGTPVPLIAELVDSTPGSVKVIAHKMGVRHARYIDARVPAELQFDYRNIRIRKKQPAAYAREVLGLEARP